MSPGIPLRICHTIYIMLSTMNKSDLSLSFKASGFKPGRCVVYPEGLDFVKVFYTLSAAICFGYKMAAEFRRDFYVFSADTGKVYHCQYISDEILK